MLCADQTIAPLPVVYNKQTVAMSSLKEKKIPIKYSNAILLSYSPISQQSHFSYIHSKAPTLHLNNRGVQGGARRHTCLGQCLGSE